MTDTPIPVSALKITLRDPKVVVPCMSVIDPGVCSHQFEPHMWDCGRAYCPLCGSFAEWPSDPRLPNPAAVPQPPPVVSDEPAIADLVLADIRARDAFGARKYGTRLQASNGRDALMDAYQAALDLVFYLRQELEERRADSEQLQPAQVQLLVD